MRLDPSYLHFITKQQLRILVAIEIGMKNHEYVPLELISAIGNLRSGETFKTLKKLLKVKLIVHVGKKFNGYKLTYLGYDYLALHTFMKRGIIKDVIAKIGVGKQSDVYKCEAVDGSHIVLKLTRLGRRSFKTIKNNRQYIQNRTSFNWLYLSRLSSIRQFTFMQILYEDGFPTPRPIDTNRHAIVMSLIDGNPLCNVKKIGEECSVKQIFHTSLELAKKFASRGLIHGDFNQFNLLVNGEGKLTVIDFPQCISSNHTNGDEYFNRDIQCLYTFFDKLMQKGLREQQDGKVHINENDIGFNVAEVPMPVLSEITVQKRLDLDVKARGHFKLSEQKQLEDFMKEWNNFNNKIKAGKQMDAAQSEEQQQIEEEQEQEDQINQIKGQIQLISKLQIKQGLQKVELDENDEDIKQLIGELKEIQNMKQNQEQSKSKEEDEEDQGDDDGSLKMRPQWKGLTAFQIRQILKQQRKKQREQKKKQMTTEQYIRRALYKEKSTRRAQIPKGNYGAKIKSKTHTQNVKQGMEMNW